MSQILRFSFLVCIFNQSIAFVSAASVDVDNKFNYSQSSGEAPKKLALSGRWTTAIKQFVGTSYEGPSENRNRGRRPRREPTAKSRVWYTGAQGILTEVYWPTIDRPQVRDSQFLVSDGKTFLFEERVDANHKIEWLETGVPAIKIVSTDPKGRFVIEKLIYSDPNREALIQKVKIKRFVSGLEIYYLHNPAVANSPLGDSSEVFDENKNVYVFSHEASEWQALSTTQSLKRASVGFEGENDGYQDLKDNFNLDNNYRSARNGNVAQTLQFHFDNNTGENEFLIVLGFGTSRSEAMFNAESSKHQSQEALKSFVSDWKKYQNSLNDFSKQSLDNGVLFRNSVAVLRSLEDKTYRGAFVASPSIPWGQHYDDKTYSTQPGEKGGVGGYHLVWPRDLYHMATTFLELGDSKVAVSSLEYLRNIQFGPRSGRWAFGFRQSDKDGSFVQNCWVDGTPFWGSLQMDQTAYPVMLAYKLWKAGHVELLDYWDMVRRGADFILRIGPWSAQERWEEVMGVSPSSVAAQISALRGASEMALKVLDYDRATRYLETAESWSAKPGDNVETWTFTSTGGFGNGKYYQRVEGASTFEQVWNPNDDVRFTIANPGGQSVREKDVVDGGFLELVRLGVRSPLDSKILDTLEEYDRYVRSDLSEGPGFYRYMGDRYNYDDSSGANTRGMLWPLLTGERGIYEFKRAHAEGKSPAEMGRIISKYIKSMENFSTPTSMMPEQVWDGGRYAGKPTGAATPLGWAHGEYIKLLASKRSLEFININR